MKKLLNKIFLFLKKNLGYILLFISFYILDLSIRFFYYTSINFYNWWKLAPNLFSFIWILLILFLIYYLKEKLGKTIYFISYILSISFFIVHAIYFSYFNMYCDWSLLLLTGEGAAYLTSVLVNIKLWMVLTILISIFLSIIGYKHLYFNNKKEPIKLLVIIIVFIILKICIPSLLGKTNESIPWDDWKNPRTIYNTFYDNNKSMMVSGMYEYNIRNFYINFIRNNKKLTNYESKLLDENFKQNITSNKNKYTGIFKNKNLIIIQLESIDDFLLTEDIMPATYKIMNNSLNFTNHYSYTSGGGSTFNSELMVNTGYSSAYTYNQSANSFIKSNYSYSLPNLLKKEGYKPNVFHMNTGKFYSRKINYKSFGYNNYYGLKDLKEYDNSKYLLDRNLILNETFYNASIKEEKPFLSSFITYSAHMPYTTKKGVCNLLSKTENLTEYECLKLQAKETDYFIKLLLDKLKEEKLLDDTIIIMYADHYLYTLEDKTILKEHKETENNLINHTPFFIWSNGKYVKTIKEINSQLDILPTILNLFGIDYYSNYYIGEDILDPSYNELIFFPNGDWYNGKTYITNGKYSFGKKISNKELNKNNEIVKRKMTLNDAVRKSNYFNNLKK